MLFAYTTLFRSGHQVPKVRLHGGDVRLRLRVGELRDRDGGQDADDHHHNQQLNECETLAVHLTLLPLKSISREPRKPGEAGFSQRWMMQAPCTASPNI